MKAKKLFLPLLILILFLGLNIMIVSAVGTCKLDKNPFVENEIALFSCSCTGVAEQAIAGNIVWKKSDGTILKTVTANSGTCQTNFFFDTFTFSSGYGNFSGNATFETVAASWNNANDVRFANFNVITANEANCIISNLQVSDNKKLGNVVSFSGNVLRGNNQTHGLGGVSCSLQIADINGAPIMLEPYANNPSSFSISSANGVFALQHSLNEKIWQKNTTYIANVQCFCPVGDKKCFDLVTGIDANVKSCSKSIAFTTGVDERRINPDLIGLGLLLIIIGICYFFLHLSESLDEQHIMFKFISLFFSILSLLLFGTVILNMTMFSPYAASGLMMYKFLLWFFRIFIAYVFIYFIFHVIWLLWRSYDQKKKGGGGVGL